MLTVSCKHLNPPYFSLPTTFKLEFFQIFKDNLNFSPISAISFSSGGGGLNDANWDFLSFVPRLSHPPLILFFSYISIFKVLKQLFLKKKVIPWISYKAGQKCPHNLLPSINIFLDEFMLCANFFCCRLTDFYAFLGEFLQIKIISSAEIFIRIFHCKLCKKT